MLFGVVEIAIMFVLETWLELSKMNMLILGEQ